MIHLAVMMYVRFGQREKSLQSSCQTFLSLHPPRSRWLLFMQIHRYFDGSLPVRHSHYADSEGWKRGLQVPFLQCSINTALQQNNRSAPCQW
jgi:hypothetical protein